MISKATATEPATFGQGRLLTGGIRAHLDIDRRLRRRRLRNVRPGFIALHDFRGGKSQQCRVTLQMALGVDRRTDAFIVFRLQRIDDPCVEMQIVSRLLGTQPPALALGLEPRTVVGTGSFIDPRRNASFAPARSREIRFAPAARTRPPQWRRPACARHEIRARELRRSPGSLRDTAVRFRVPAQRRRGRMRCSRAAGIASGKFGRIANARLKYRSASTTSPVPRTHTPALTSAISGV